MKSKGLRLFVQPSHRIDVDKLKLQELFLDQTIGKRFFKYLIKLGIAEGDRGNVMKEYATNHGMRGTMEYLFLEAVFYDSAVSFQTVHLDLESLRN